MDIRLGESFIIEDVPQGSVFKKVTMVWINPGSFLMGSAVEEDGRKYYDKQVLVNITEGFWIGKFPITFSQWIELMGYDPSSSKELKIEEPKGDCPVIFISWDEAVMFCERMNKKYGTKLPKGYYFSLPLETQWEYACRAESMTRHYGGNTEKELSDIAWYSGNSSGKLHPVGLKKGNKWSLYDMMGNVFEWCYDEYEEFQNYPDEIIVDRIRESKERGEEKAEYSLKVIRSLSYVTPYDDFYSRSATREYQTQDSKSLFFGFRLSLIKK